ncbi:MAG: PH domain-containing protein, partial [Candidatus Shapirobacteria bacterium]
NEPQNQNPQSSENISNNAIDNGKEISSDVYKLSPAVIFVRFLYPLLIILFAFFYIFSGKNLKGSDLGNAYLGFVEVAFAVFVFGSLIYQIIWYKNFYFHFGKDKGEIRTKVIAQSTSYVYYDRMQNINISQGVLDRLFGLYRISIETAGEKSGSSLVLYGYRGNDAQEIRNFLLEKADLFQAGRDRL